MITSITAKNQAEYQKLFAEASAFLVANGKLDPAYSVVELTPDQYAAGYYYVSTGENAYELCEDEAFSADKTYYIQSSAITTLEDYFCHLGDLYETPERKDKFFLLPLDEDAFEIDANTRKITVPSSFKSAGIGVKGDNVAETLLFKINRFFDAIDLADTKIFVQWERSDGVQYVSEITMKDTETYLDESKFIFGWPISDYLTKVAGTIKFAVRFIKQNTEGKIIYSFSTLTTTATINAGLDFDLDNVNLDDSASDLFEEVIQNSSDSAGPNADEPEFIINATSPMNMVNDGSGNYSATMKCQVAVEDLGQPYFKWYFRKDENTKRVNLASGANEYQEGKTVFEKTIDTVRQVNKNYYAKVDNAYVRDDDSDVSELYEQFAVLTLTGKTADVVAAAESPVTGTYFVEAVNRLGRKETSKRSEFITVPAPTKPEIVTDVEGELTRVDDKASISTKFKSDDAAELTYVWKRSENMEDWNEVAGSTGSSLTADNIGYYKVEATAVLNLGKISTESSICKVVDLPVAPVWAEGYGEDDRKVIDIPAEKLTAVLAENPADKGALYSEKIYFKWVDRDTGALYATTDEPELAITAEALENGNALRCIAVNELNGKTAEAKGAVFALI